MSKSLCLFFLLTNFFLVQCSPKVTTSISSETTSASNSEELVAPKDPFSEFLANEDYWEDRMKLAQIFQKERVALGSDFKPELLKLVKGNKERCYWLSYFLSADSYLEEHEPDLPLAIQLLEIGLETSEEDERSNRCSNYSMLVTAMVLSEQLHLRDQAIAYCVRYLDYQEKFEDVGGCFPAFSEEEHNSINEIEAIAKKK